MSFHCHCLEGLSIRKCIVQMRCCCCCCPKKQVPARSRATHSRVMMIHDLSLDLCVVSAPHRHLASLGDDDQEGEWDFLTVGKQKDVVLLAGPRFTHFALADRDTYRGQNISDVFPRGIVDILMPVLDMALGGNSSQLHTIFKSQSLTMFAYPITNEVADVIGAHVVYRPTKYTQADIASLISRGTAARHPATATTP